MPNRTNALGQPIGFALTEWTPCPMPPRTDMQGVTCRLEPLNGDRHADDLFAAFGEDADNRLWTYMAIGPFAHRDAFKAWVDSVCEGDDPLFYAIIDLATSRAVGFASYMRIDPVQGVIEVGSIVFAPALQRTTAATEAMYLMMKRVFAELGYRRYEWKCDDLNAASRAAARRYGFVFEGVFRQAVVYKNRNRDTAWFAITDRDWPAIDASFTAWLAPANRDHAGRQIKSLAAFMPL